MLQGKFKYWYERLEAKGAVMTMDAALYNAWYTTTILFLFCVHHSLDMKLRMNKSTKGLSIEKSRLPKTAKHIFP